MAFTTEAFIAEIEKRPTIWDPTTEDYSNKILKRNAWEEVIVIFNPDFNEKNPSEQHSIAMGMQRKWKSLRDCFTRELGKRRNETSASGRKQYLFFQRLQFLETVAKPSRRKASNDEDPGVEGGHVEFRQSKRKKRVPKESVVDNELMDFVKAEYTTTREEDYEPPNDEDRLFMLSLVPELKKLPEYLKLETKSEILNVIKSARQQSLSGSY